MIHFGSACQVATQTHCYGAGCYFCQSGDPDQMVLARGYGAAEAGSQGKGNGEAVGHTDDDVGEDGRALHMLFFVSMLCVMSIRMPMLCSRLRVILRLVGSCTHISS